MSCRNCWHIISPGFLLVYNHNLLQRLRDYHARPQTTIPGNNPLNRIHHCCLPHEVCSIFQHQCGWPTSQPSYWSWLVLCTKTLSKRLRARTGFRLTSQNRCRRGICCVYSAFYIICYQRRLRPWLLRRGSCDAQHNNCCCAEVRA